LLANGSLNTRIHYSRISIKDIHLVTITDFVYRHHWYEFFFVIPNHNIMLEIQGNS